MKKFILFFFFSFTLIFTNAGLCQISYSGGKGLYKVLEADPIRAADIYFSTNMSSFMREEPGAKVLTKYFNFNTNLTVGLANYLECFVNFVPHRDDQQNLYGTIGDTHFGLKYLTPLSSSVFKLGVAGTYKFPTAVIPNLPFEVFSTDKPAWAIKALLSLDFLPVMPSMPLKFNLNFGYIDHNIYDEYFYSKIDQLLFGTGFKYSIRSLHLYTEYSGEVFFNNPTQVKFNQNSMRITQGIRFLGPWNNIVNIAFNLSFTKYDSLKNLDIFHKEYATWELKIGISHRFTVYKYFDKSAKLERKRREEERRKLEAIKKKRQNVKKDLKKMKDELDKKKKKNGSGKKSG
ncbi:hypothetical protein H8E88_11050 [candidate division KSB1 bacterium]|nr:hypothetical protein [candidate division KSB1 bacterium]